MYDDVMVGKGVIVPHCQIESVVLKSGKNAKTISKFMDGWILPGGHITRDRLVARLAAALIDEMMGGQNVRPERNYRGRNAAD